MGQLTSEKQKELMKSYYDKYYALYFPKYGKRIDAYIQKFFPQKSRSKRDITTSKKMTTSYQMRSKNVNRSFKELAESAIDFIIPKPHSTSKSKSRDFTEFLYDLIFRRILIYELRNFIYTHIPNKDEFSKCFKNPEDSKSLKYISSGEYGYVYQLNENVCIKVVNITSTLNNLKYIDFLKEMEISKIAGNIGVGPKIHDAYVCVNDADSTCYGIIYMEYLQGITLSKYLDNTPKNQYGKVRTLLDEKIAKLHQHHILHSDLHSDNVFVLLNSQKEMVDLKIIDYGFSQYIQDYIYFRNHYRLNDELFHFSRHYIYHELAHLLYQKLTK